MGWAEKRKEETQPSPGRESVLRDAVSKERGRRRLAGRGRKEGKKTRLTLSCCFEKQEINSNF